jgi:hypothetical protein
MVILTQFLGREMFQTSCQENQNTHFMLNNFFSENRAVYETMSKNVLGPDMPQMTTQKMCFAWWKTKAADSHS